jgi:hypothetical protein
MNHAVPPSARPAVEAVRANPKWYFPSGAFEIDQLLGMLASEASAHGSRDFFMTETDHWWVVASSHDWLRDVPSAFEAPTPDPERGANVSRVEVLLTAFCPRVISVAAGVVSDIVGTDAPPVEAQALLDDRTFARVIAFLPPPTPGEQPRHATGRHLQLVPELDPRAFDAAFEGFDRKELQFANLGSTR